MPLSSEEKLPRLSYDLIDMLVDVYRHPLLPTTMVMWGRLDDAELLRLSFQAGQASVVHALVSTKDAELYDAETPDSADKPTGLLDAPLFEQGRVIRTADALDFLDDNDI